MPTGPGSTVAGRRRTSGSLDAQRRPPIGQPTAAGSTRPGRRWRRDEPVAHGPTHLGRPASGRSSAAAWRSRRQPTSPSSPAEPATGATRGSAQANQPVQRSDGRERHHVERPAPVTSSARARTTSTWRDRAASTTSVRKVVRRSSGSSRVTVRSGRAIASTRPGSPAPEPTSITARPAGRAAEQRAVQQVPVPEPGGLTRPDQTTLHPVGGQQTRRIAQRGSRSDAKSSVPRARAWRLFHVKHRSMPAGRMTTQRRRLDALGLRAQASGRDRVVHDLALERRHRAQRHRARRSP